MRYVHVLSVVFLVSWGCGDGAVDDSDAAPDRVGEVAADGTAPIDAADGAIDNLPQELVPDQAVPDQAVPDQLDMQPEEIEQVCDLSACPAGTGWEVGQPIFKEVTADWGLTAMAVKGIRLSVTDIDGDGWADLLVRNGGGPDDFGPDGVRGRWVLRNTGAGMFEDVTQSSGLFTARYKVEPEGALPGDLVASADVDNDGDWDIYVAGAVHKVKPGQETAELMLNNGDGTFVPGPADSDLRAEGQYAVPAGATFVDYNRDGFVDLWNVHNMVGGLSQPLQDRLYEGDGTGHFLDVTIQAGLESKPWLFPPDDLNAGLGHTWAWSSAACDLNNDGVQELLASSYGRCPNHLWQGKWDDNGTVTYENVSTYSGYAYDHRTDWSDNESARCFCKLHPDAEDCEGVPPPQYVKCDSDADIFRWIHDMDREPWRLGGNSAATSCVDVDNDGFVDLMTGEIVHWDVGSSSDPAELMFNSGEYDVRFKRPGNEATGLIREYPGPIWDNGDMTNLVFDFDNDGWIDVYIGSSDYPYTKGLLFHQESPRHFARVEVDDYFEHLRSHGVTAADFDRDGDLDMVVGHSKHRCGGDYLADCYDTQEIRMFENLMGGADSNWVQFRLEGSGNTNRGAVGARVSVSACGVTQTRDVDGGHGHFGTQKDPVLHFGMGPACEAGVQIRWPDAGLTTQSFEVSAGHRYFVLQGEEPKLDD